MTTENKPLTTKQQLKYVGVGFLIAIAYTVWFVVLTDDREGLFGFEIIPEANAQILPFEQQLEQIRNPAECTRKVVQGSSAEVPFTFKLFYDTTSNIKLEFKQQGTSFPVRQTTNQVMTFFTEEPDQYEVYFEVNYEDAKERQVYIEFLSNNAITQSTQEKFVGKKFCMTLFANTVVPTPIPTKEEIFGESLDYISQIPAMVTAFNANSQTSATSISYMWVLLLAVFLFSILTYLNSIVRGRKFDSKMRDLDDTVEQVNTMTLSMDKLMRSISVPLEDTRKELATIKKSLQTILKIPQIKENIPVEQKQDKGFMKIIKKIQHGKKKEVVPESKNEPDSKPLPSSTTTQNESDEIKEALEATAEEIEEEKKQEPSGGFVLSEDDEKTEITLESGVQKEKHPVETQMEKLKDAENPMKKRPEHFIDVLRDIDFEKKMFKENTLDNWTYNQLNECYSWIVKYRKWALVNRVDIPEKNARQQEIAEKVIYYAIFAKMEKKMSNGK